MSRKLGRSRRVWAWIFTNGDARYRLYGIIRHSRNRSVGVHLRITRVSHRTDVYCGRTRCTVPKWRICSVVQKVRINLILSLLEIQRLTCVHTLRSHAQMIILTIRHTWVLIIYTSATACFLHSSHNEFANYGKCCDRHIAIHQFVSFARSTFYAVRARQRVNDSYTSTGIDKIPEAISMLECV